jgi:anti-sigma B factor antagonist
MPSEQFAVSTVEGVVHVEGEIDSHVAPAFDDVLQALPGSLTLDCSAVTFLDSMGISVLVRHYRQRCEEGGSLRLVALSRPVWRALEITQLLEMLTGCPSGDVATAPLSYTDERASRSRGGAGPSAPRCAGGPERSFAFA